MYFHASKTIDQIWVLTLALDCGTVDPMPVAHTRVDTVTVMHDMMAAEDPRVIWRRHVVTVRRLGYAGYHRQSADSLTFAKANRGRLLARKRKVAAMPKVIEKRYRDNAGREAMAVEGVGGSIAEFVDFMAQQDRGQYSEFGLAEFTAVDPTTGETVIPSGATSVKALQVEGLRRGLAIGHGESETPEESFLAVIRGTLTGLKRIPAGLVSLANRSKIAWPEGFTLVSWEEAVNGSVKTRYRLTPEATDDEVEVEDE